MKKKDIVPEQFIKALSMQIKNRREELGISQEQLAEQADLHRTYVSMIERKGANISVRIFFRIAQALDVSPLALVLAAQKGLKTRAR